MLTLKSEGRGSTNWTRLQRDTASLSAVQDGCSGEADSATLQNGASGNWLRQREREKCPASVVSAVCAYLPVRLASHSPQLPMTNLQPAPRPHTKSSAMELFTLYHLQFKIGVAGELASKLSGQQANLPTVCQGSKGESRKDGIKGQLSCHGFILRKQYIIYGDHQWCLYTLQVQDNMSCGCK